MKKKLFLLSMCSCILAAGMAIGSTAEETTEAVTEAVTEEPLTATVNPLPETIDMENLEECTVAVSFEEGDVYRDEEDAVQMKVKVYTYHLFDMVDMAMLQPGDVMPLSGKNVEVVSVEKSDNGDVLINGGLDQGGYELCTSEGGVFYETGYSDVKAWNELGEVILPVAEEFVFTDSSDLDNEPVEYDVTVLMEEDEELLYHFVPQNSQIVILDGEVIALNRIYMP